MILCCSFWTSFSCNHVILQTPHNLAHAYVSGLSFKVQFYKIDYNSCCEFIDGLSVEKILMTTSNCDMDSSHEFQDSSPNPLEHFKVSALMRQFQIQGVVLTF